MATTSEMTMAAISVPAEIRHQNQRRMKRPPVPAPRSNSRLKACPAEVRVKLNAAPATNERMVASGPHRPFVARSHSGA